MVSLNKNMQSNTMTSLNLKLLFKEYVENSQKFEYGMNGPDFCTFIVRSMKYDISSYTLDEAVLAYLQLLAENNVIKVDIISDCHNFKLSDTNINYIDYFKIKKHDANVEMLVKYNSIIRNDGFITESDDESHLKKELEKKLKYREEEIKAFHNKVVDLTKKLEESHEQIKLDRENQVKQAVRSKKIISDTTDAFVVCQKRFDDLKLKYDDALAIIEEYKEKLHENTKVNVEVEENAEPITSSGCEEKVEPMIPPEVVAEEKVKYKYAYVTSLFCLDRIRKKFNDTSLTYPHDPVEYDVFYQNFLDNLGNMTSYEISSIEALDTNKFKIQSRYTGNYYEIDVSKKKETSSMICTCPDHTYREHDCKHIKSLMKIAGEYMKSYHAEK